MTKKLTPREKKTKNFRRERARRKGYKVVPKWYRQEKNWIFRAKCKQALIKDREFPLFKKDALYDYL